MEPRLKFASDITVKDGVITVVLSNEAVDRDGDIVRAAGWDLTNFTKAPRLMSCHDYGDLRKQIGEWRNVRIDPERKALVGEAYYYTEQGNPEADWGHFLATQGQATYSVGFIPLEADSRKAHGGSEFTSQELLECSHVPIPSNPEALQLMAKALKARSQGEDKQRRPGGIVQKWDSNYVGESDYTPMEVRCLVPGCDDACQLTVPVCSEHLKVLMNADAEPPGSPPDDDEAMLRALRRAKAGRRNSESDSRALMAAHDHLHTVLGMPKHDGDGEPEEESDDTEGTAKPATERDKGAVDAHGNVIEGNVIRNNGDAGIHMSPVGAHDKSHSELPDSAFAYIAPGGEKQDGKTTPLSLRHYPHHTESGGVDKGLLRSALSRIGDSSNEQGGKAHLEAHAKAEGIGEAADDKKTVTNGLDPQALSDALTAHLSALLEVALW